MALIKVLMIQGMTWMEIHVPNTGVSDQLYWLKKYVQPHAIQFPGGIWDEVNGWREKTLTSEYYHKFVKEVRNEPRILFKKLMEDSIYGQQQHLFQEMMRGDTWTDTQQDIIKQREAAQWGTMGLLRPPLNQLSAFQNDLGA